MALASEQIAVQIAAQDLASAVIQRVNTNVNTLTTSTRNAGTGAIRMGEGLGKAANAVTNLAGNMLGVNNQVANLAEGLLTFAVGGPVVTGIAAGIAVLAAGWLRYSKEAREARKATDDVLNRLNESADEREGVPVRRNIAEVRLEVARLEVQLERLRANPFAVALGLTKETEQALARARRAFGELATQNAAELPEIEVSGVSGARRAEELRRAFLARGLNSVEADLRGGERGAIGGGDLALKQLDTATLLNVDTPQRITEVTNALGPLASALDAVGASLGDVKLAFGETFTAAIASANTFADATIGAVGKAIKGTAGVLAREQYAKAAAKFAEGLFPPNPAAIASALKHILAGSLFARLAGSGGGASLGGAGSGGGTARDFQRRTDALSDGLGPVQVVVPRDAVMHAGDPRWQEFLAETIRRLTGRRVTLVPA